tara:strand:- start:2352 stop:3032 length:681 start_codon:yes stop_codon:yes gene_type:complete
MPTPSHTLGHRQRLRERFLSGGEKAVADYELLELLLFGALPRGDVKPLAKALLRHFKTVKGVLTAPPQELARIEGIGHSCIALLKTAETLSHKIIREEARESPIIHNWEKLVDYCKATMGHLRKEQLRLLFLDRRNRLISDEVQQEGTIDQAPIYPREVVTRALELGASALILVHNHPSGDPTPSQADIEITKRVEKCAQTMGVLLHDHLIIGRGKHISLRAEKLI